MKQLLFVIPALLLSSPMAFAGQACRPTSDQISSAEQLAARTIVSAITPSLTAKGISLDLSAPLTLDKICGLDCMAIDFKTADGTKLKVRFYPVDYSSDVIFMAQNYTNEGNIASCEERLESLKVDDVINSETYDVVATPNISIPSVTLLTYSKTVTPD
jgi:hypothetical protein